MAKVYRYPDQGDALLTKSVFSRYSRDYWEESEKAILERCLNQAFSSKSPEAKSADIGCGLGRLIGVLAQRSAEVVAVEPTQDRYEEALRTAANFPNATVLNATADALPAESFDVVLCSHVIQHVTFDEQRILVANLHRILKPGGYLILTTTFNAGSQSTFCIEYGKGDELVLEAIDADGFNGAYAKGLFPIQKFSRADLLGQFVEFKTIDCGCYHFLDAKEASDDDVFNRLGKLESACDSYYLFQK